MRLAAPITLLAVSACTSTSSTRLPCIAAVITLPLGCPPRAVLLDEEVAGVGHFLQPFAGHFEQTTSCVLPKRFFTQRTMRWE